MPGPYSSTMSATIVMVDTMLVRCGNRLDYSIITCGIKLQCYEETMMDCRKDHCVQSWQGNDTLDNTDRRKERPPSSPISPYPRNVNSVEIQCSR